MSRRELDAIVVGAGPAGLTFARFLSSRGFNVMVFEKEEMLAKKPCGEAISSHTLETASLTRSDVEMSIAQPVREALILAPDGTPFYLKGDRKTMGFVLEKTLFLNVLAAKAGEEGAKLSIRDPVKKFHRRGDMWEVEAVSGTYTARLLVGADGYRSLVARTTGLEKSGERKLIPTIRYLMMNVNHRDPEVTEFYLGNNIAPLGYAWIFPKGEKYSNVGIGVQKGGARQYLDKFIHSRPEFFSKAVIVDFRGAAVTIGGMLRKIVADSLMLIGEAAGQVIPLTGGGIHTSIAGGRIGAEVAAEALEKEDLSENMLNKYVERYNEYWGRRIKNSLKALHAIEALTDEELNLLARILEPDDVIKLANGIEVASVAKKLIRHPILSAKIAAKLLSS